MDNLKDIFSYGISAEGESPNYRNLMYSLNQPAFRAEQLAQWLWAHDVGSYDDMANLPAALRERLGEIVPLRRAEVQCVQQSKDGTRKYLLRFADGVSVEAVGLPSVDTNKNRAKSVSADAGECGNGAATRLTVCVSSQAGCAMACSFCATGRGGFVRNLLPGEIAEQVRIVGADFGQRVSNVVVMGQGEPFLNYDAVLAALRIINASEKKGGMGIGARHITLSTAGIIEGIKRLANESEQFTLAVSLHSAVQTTRDKMMPGLRDQPLKELNAALLDYFDKTGRRPSLEFTLVEGLNDSPFEAEALIAFAKGLRAHVNLIPLNSVRAHSKLQASHQTEALDFARALLAEGVDVTLRKRRGADIDAACGQLSQKQK